MAVRISEVADRLGVNPETVRRAAGIVLPDDLPGGGPVAPDDVVDAAIAAWSAARAAAGESMTLPANAVSDPVFGGVIHY